jgi:hypothetical protein
LKQTSSVDAVMNFHRNLSRAALRADGSIH